MSAYVCVRRIWYSAIAFAMTFLTCGYKINMKTRNTSILFSNIVMCEIICSQLCTVISCCQKILCSQKYVLKNIMFSKILCSQKYVVKEIMFWKYHVLKNIFSKIISKILFSKLPSVLFNFGRLILNVRLSHYGP